MNNNHAQPGGSESGRYGRVAEVVEGSNVVLTHTSYIIGRAKPFLRRRHVFEFRLSLGLTPSSRSGGDPAESSPPQIALFAVTHRWDTRTSPFSRSCTSTPLPTGRSSLTV